MDSLLQVISDRWFELLTPMTAVRILDALPWTFAVLVLVAVVLAALRRSGRTAILLLLALLAIGGGFGLLSKGIEERIGRVRLDVAGQMNARPGDPWPRGNAHVPLGRPGAAEMQKGYLEAGGSFSPAPGSFGISFWAVDGTGTLVATSDDVPLGLTQATYGPARGEPAIAVRTPYFTATWTAQGDGDFTLDLVRLPGFGGRVDIVVRSVGPSGGPLRTIDLSARQLRLNSAWTVGPLPADVSVTLGVEGSAGWKSSRDTTTKSLTDPSGWLFARLSATSDHVTLHVHNDAAPAPERIPGRVFRDAKTIALDGADPVFASALNAQIETLKQGLVADQTRPGDPLNYPLEWLRDGAYIVTALARAGEIDLAARLALAAAPKDFFGGFGAEADAPGLGLWMLGEVSLLARRNDFDQAAWPHVERKARLILNLLRADGVVSHDFTGPVVPSFEGNPELRTVSYGTRRGMIDGRMDWQRPLFFVNAASYGGLVAAADFARRNGKADQASSWQTAADRLKRSWRAAFEASEMADDVLNDRTAISGLWPFSIAEPAAFERLMERRWLKQSGQWQDPDYRPPWTYFSVAEAHQWLWLDHPERARLMMDRLWSQQDIPGLFTLREGRGEVNTFNRWREFRGWISPPAVTPHYWSAAEALLLQLAMLAEARGTEPEEVLAIGAGVPADWLQQPLAFKGIGTSLGPVAWVWDGRRVTVTLPAARDVPVSLGKAFPKGTAVDIVRPAVH